MEKSFFTGTVPQNLADEILNNSKISRAEYDRYDVKRGLRNKDGTGVITGLTQIGDVIGYDMIDGKKTPAEGRLLYRGYNLKDLVNGYIDDGRFGFEEIAYLLIFGSLPSSEGLASFKSTLAKCRPLPVGFTEAMILAAPSRDIMNKLARSTLALYTYDPSPDFEEGNIAKELTQALHLIARFPVIASYALSAKRHYFDNESLFLHTPCEDYSTAENLLYLIRQDNEFSEEEARLLDLCLVIHAEHGGGNNSAFACRVLSSTRTDIYSSISAAVGSLKGPRHGGANIKVSRMFDTIKENVSNWEDKAEISTFLEKLLKKEAGDGSGLIYGMGHAIYTLSDPRTVLLKQLAGSLSEKKHMEKEFNLIRLVEELTPDIYDKVIGNKKTMCANVDMYSGFVYKMLGIPQELFTPIFAVARVVGWCAHRIEEVFSDNRIIRPAYKAMCPQLDYIPINKR